ncbi:MAG: C45 family peptidase [Solibacillus sp.]
MQQLAIRVVNLMGSSFELGLKQGEEIKTTELIKQLKFLEYATINSNSVDAKKLLTTLSPNLLEELVGLSKGLEMKLDTVIRFYSGYDVNFPAMGCTTLINEGNYVRNYDFSPEMYDARLVFSNPIDGYASVGFSQQVIGRLDGMNEKGLVIGLHFVNNEHKREGFFATTIVRMVLDQCACIEEAIHLLSKIPHGYCYNYSMTDSSGKGVIVEASPEKQCVHIDMPIICTNHFQSKDLQSKNMNEIERSVRRKECLRDLVTIKGFPISAYHHFNNANSPLFFKNYQEYFGTLHTVVYSPKDLSVIIGVGENSEPTKLSLKKYLEGSCILPKTIKGKIVQAIKAD